LLKDENQEIINWGMIMRKRLPRRAMDPFNRTVPITKAIGINELEESGKLYPSQQFGESGILPEEEKGSIELTWVNSNIKQAESDLPPNGLIITPTSMAEAVIDGKKSIIVKTRPFEISDRVYLLINEQKALGIVALGKLTEMSLAELQQTEDEHLINMDLRAKWMSKQPRWENGPFYAWPVKVVEKFDQPQETNVGPDPQVVVHDVKIKKQIKTNPKDLFFYIRLPESVRNTLTEISQKYASKTGAKVEDVDHVTLLYLRGGDNGFSEADAKKAQAVAQKTLSKFLPISAKIQGWGYFDGASKDGKPCTALVVLLDAPDLSDVYTAIKGAVVEAGLQEEDQSHGFIPHATIAYLSFGGRCENLPKLNSEFVIDQVELAHSEIHELDFGVEKIRDPKTYDPSKISDEVLRDDHRLTLAWYTTWKKNPEGFKYDLETLELLLRKILEEAARRGPETMRFSPKDMKPFVREFWERVAREVKLPEVMIRRVIVAPDIDVIGKTNTELIELHWRLHELFEAKIELGPRGPEGITKEEIVNLHALVVDELYDREIVHPSPPGDGLDDVSGDFERYAEKQPDYDKPPWQKIEKREYAWINASGVERGEEISLTDVLKHFKTFKTKQPYVYLVGGLANRGKTKGDIDILVKDTEDLPESFKHVIHFRLGRALPSDLAERLEIHYDNFHGPMTNNVPLYDLTFERINPKNEIKLMGMELVEKYETRVVSSDFEKQAERAEKHDKLTLGEFFYMPKPTRPAFPYELQTLRRFLSLYRERAEIWLPAFVQKKYDGARHQVHKDGNKIKIISENGEDNVARLPQTIEEISNLKVDKLVFDCEIELWQGRQHLPREAIAGYLHSKDEPNDTDIITNIFDVLYHDKDGDIHNWPVQQRLEVLEKLDIKQSTMGVPDLKHRLNVVPGAIAHDLEELEKIVRKIRELPGSEGVVCKQIDSPYPLKEVALDLWVKYHNSSTVRGIVIGREKTKGGIWVYQWGVLPSGKPVETVDIKDKTIVPVGDTFATKLDFDEGDSILIEGETINIEVTPKGERMSVWVPRVIGPWTDKADTIDSAATRAKRNLVLQVKKIDEEGNIEYLPTRTVEKQADPYMEIPPEEEGPYDYAVQHHIRGRGLHSDLRIVLRPKKLLIGWTLLTGIKDAIKEPIITLSEARQLSRTRMDKISKINWDTGEWAKRAKRGVEKPVRTSIQAIRKSPEPIAWKDVEGVTKKPELGKPPPIGGTRHFPGVFQIVDRGKTEYGSQKSWFHEYFFHGEALNYRVIFRQLRLKKDLEVLPDNLKNEIVDRVMQSWQLEVAKSKPSRKQCMYDGCKRAPEIDVLWADGRGRAWFCKEHFVKWKQDFKDRNKENWLEIVGEKGITIGEAPKKWADVHKKDCVPQISKAILPPSEESELPGPVWLCIRPDDQTPYVLDKDAVKKGWMPPVGVSALPKAVREQIPIEYHYWKKKTVATAKQVRDGLYWAVKTKNVEIDYTAPYKREVTKTSMLDAKFVLQEQTWRGPIQIRVGPSRTLWQLRLDVGRPDLIVLEMYLNPLDNKQLATRVTEDPHKESMNLAGPIKPSHYLNPTKTTPSNIEILDSGKASVFSYSNEFIKVQLKGEKLKGLYQAKRSNDDWLWSRSKSGPEVKKDFDKIVDEFQTEIAFHMPITKVNKEKQLVTGVVLEPNVIDAQGDIISAEAIERAAHTFLARYNRATQLGLLHEIFGENGIELVESWIAPVDLKLGSQRVKQGTWLMTNKIIDDALWKRVKSGDITGFSIGGTATVL